LEAPRIEPGEDRAKEGGAACGGIKFTIPINTLSSQRWGRKGEELKNTRGKISCVRGKEIIGSPARGNRSDSKHLLKRKDRKRRKEILGLTAKFCQI